MIKILHYRGAKYLRIASLSLGAVAFGLYERFLINTACWLGPDLVAPSMWSSLFMIGIMAVIGAVTAYAFVVVAQLVFVYLQEGLLNWLK